MRSHFLGYVNVSRLQSAREFSPMLNSVVHTVLFFVQLSRVLPRTLLKISRVREFVQTVGHSHLVVCLQSACLEEKSLETWTCSVVELV